ncbi:unnamed protein product [Effrenium voratum]|uniref:Uncharacterized protein n=1 Tax=Effrenium voratum TaxID=2562239 RepID=A0AA36HNN6_9DINO|nr:unnamed protein product [Effrenium voratum]CAJ1416911.1 unnamed protein product [Effrenium voratum]
MDGLVDGALGRVFQYAEGYDELLASMFVCSHWSRTITCNADLQGLRQDLARRCCLPETLSATLEADWVEFCAQQLHLQTLVAGKYMGSVTPENLPRHVPPEVVDWEQPMDAVADLWPMTTAERGDGKSSVGKVRHRFVGHEQQELWEIGYEWLVLDIRRPFHKALWKQIQRTTQLEAPAARWEDGDLHCGVRSSADFRPAVDPSFLDLSDIIFVMCPAGDGANDTAVSWSLKLFAPCAWMLSKRSSWLEQLDHQARMRHEGTAAALVLGTQLEKSLRFSELEQWQEVGKSVPEAAAELPATGKRRRKKCTEPRDFRSRRNPKGLNLYIPRRKSSDRQYAPGPGPKVRPKQVLSCLAAAELEDFVTQHPPAQLHAEQLCVRLGGAIEVPDTKGLLEDALRLEKSGSLTQATVVQLAKKWQILSGKWLLSVPDWRIDELFALSARRWRDGDLPGCCQLQVFAPSNENRYMLSAHVSDFTDRQSVMSLGKCLRAAARQGLCCPSGRWGELLDDPFASPGKKVSLVFKPEVFSRLNLNKKNPYGIKTTLYMLDL